MSRKMRGKGDVIFDDIIADVQAVQISGHGSSELALHSCHALLVCLAKLFVPLCQLCQCVSSRNNHKLTLSSMPVYQSRLKLSMAKSSQPHSSFTTTNPSAGPISQVTLPKLGSSLICTGFVCVSEPQLVSQLNRVHTFGWLMAYAISPSPSDSGGKCNSSGG